MMEIAPNDHAERRADLIRKSLEEMTTRDLQQLIDEIETELATHEVHGDARSD